MRWPIPYDGYLHVVRRLRACLLRVLHKRKLRRAGGLNREIWPNTLAENAY
jgi:hypothetical protein